MLAPVTVPAVVKLPPAILPLAVTVAVVNDGACTLPLTPRPPVSISAPLVFVVDTVPGGLNVAVRFATLGPPTLILNVLPGVVVPVTKLPSCTYR